MTTWAWALTFFLVALGVGGLLWASIRAAGRYDRDADDDALIDEGLLNADLRTELSDISFGAGK